jgi:hypothetical protein
LHPVSPVPLMVFPRFSGKRSEPQSDDGGYRRLSNGIGGSLVSMLICISIKQLNGYQMKWIFLSTLLALC